MVYIKEYFDILQSSFPSDYKKTASIRDVTVKMAELAGYKREPHTFANGNVREMTKYERPFDDLLVAEWLLYFKKLFIGKLTKLPKLKEYWVDIINEVFYSVMRSLVIERLINDAVVVRYVNKSLSDSISDYLKEIGSISRFQEWEDSGKLRFKQRRSLNYNMLSVDATDDDGNLMLDVVDEEDHFQEMLLDMYKEIGDDDLSNRLLDAMLFSGKKVLLYKIDDYIEMSEEEKTEDNKLKLRLAYNKIKKVLKHYVNQQGKNWKPVPAGKVHYVSEGKH